MKQYTQGLNSFISMEYTRDYLYDKFSDYLFFEFEHSTYQETINYIKSIEYDKVAKLRNFSYEELVNLLQYVSKQSSSYIKKLFSYCLEESEIREFRYHGLLISLDSGDEISTYLKNKDYRKLLEKIIKDLDIS